MGGDEVRLAAASRTGGGERDQGRGKGHGSARRSRRRWPGGPVPPPPFISPYLGGRAGVGAPFPFLLPHLAARSSSRPHLSTTPPSACVSSTSCRSTSLLGLRLWRPTPCRRFLLPHVPPLFGVAVSTLPPAAILPRPPPPPLLPVFPLASSSASA